MTYPSKAKYPSTLGPVCTIKSKAWDMKQYSVLFFFSLNILQINYPIQKLYPRNNTPEKKSKARDSTFKGLKILDLFAVFFSTGCNGKL